MTNRKIIEELVQQELKEANEKHPLFHSAHEAYAVIKEEVEEAESELELLQEQIGYMWMLIKNDNNMPLLLQKAKIYAENLAAEAIQVTAMCQKALDSEV